MKGVSLFSSGGVGETYLKDIGIEIVLANELIEKRAKFYSHFHPKTNMICGDICDPNIKSKIIRNITNDMKILIATPPCQGLSSLGKNKIQNQFIIDRRNFLILEIFEIIDKSNFDYILIENVPKFLTMYFPYENELLLLEEILNKKYSSIYKIEVKVLNAKDFGVPQSRPRAIIKLYKFDKKWDWPNTQNEVTLREAISHLPSLEAGEKSDILWHNAKWHNEREVLAMKYTPEGKSAFKNEVHFPKKEDGSRVNGFHNTYKRLVWDMPCHARTTNSGNIGSHNNVHPGRKLPDGTYSDARVLTLLETFIVSSLPHNWDVPKEYSDTFIRQMIGESIPPLLLKKIIEKINEKNE